MDYDDNFKFSIFLYYRNESLEMRPIILTETEDEFKKFKLD